jgi:MoxR-like ATPase
VTRTAFANPEELAAALKNRGYFADTGLVTAAFLAYELQRPLLLEGEPGVGKTTFAQWMATITGAAFERLQCYEGIDASAALYEWNFPKQILRLRALGTAGPSPASGDSLYSEEYLSERPILRALRTTPSVLLIDEIDRADEEFEAVLLEVLDTYTISIPEFRTIRATTPPLVVLTSNRTREVHDALRRRCLYHWIPYPEPSREIMIVRHAVPQVPEGLVEEVVAAVGALRAQALAKPPSTSETVECARALRALGVRALDERALTAVLPTLLKQSEDVARAGRPDGLISVYAAIDRARRQP